MSELLCPRCGQISMEIEVFRIAMLMILIFNRDYKRLKQFQKLTNEQLVEFHKQWRKLKTSEV